jgi:hypothetical protein
MKRMWLSRLRWRLRGAWLWPAFAGLTVADGFVLHAWPLAGQGLDLPSALLLGGFVNLAAVALIGPLGARLVRRRRPDLPRVVALDYAGTALLLVATAALAAGGLIHHGAVMRERHATAFATVLARDYLARRAPAPYRGAGGGADTYRVDPGRVYRTCFAGTGEPKPFCVVVHLETSPPTLVPDGHEPNSSWAPRGGY